MQGPTTEPKPLKPLSEDLLRAIGLVATQWSHFEWTIQYCIARIAQLHVPIAFLVTKSGTYRSWRDTLLALVSALPQHKGKQSALEEFFKKQERLQIERNIVVHTHWVPTTRMVDGKVERVSSPTIATGLSSPKGGQKAMVQTVRTLDQMLTLAKEIEFSCDELLTIVSS